MSIWSGRCDLADTIGGLGGWFDRDGNPVKMGDPGVGCYFSDEMRDFRVFKKETGGILYQHKSVKVTNYNAEWVAKNNEFFKIIKEEKTRKTKNGVKKYTKTYYEYFGKKYRTLKRLNMEKVYYTKKIHIDTILDLIPYYPYLVSSFCRGDGKMAMFISSESYVDFEESDCGGSDSSIAMAEYYRKRLQKHYIEVFENYLNRTNRIMKESLVVKKDGDKLIVTTEFPIDATFEIDVERTLHTWTYSSPKVVDYEKGIIDVSEVWPNELNEGDTVIINYTKVAEDIIHIS